MIYDYAKSWENYREDIILWFFCLYFNSFRSLKLCEHKTIVIFWISSQNWVVLGTFEPCSWTFDFPKKFTPGIPQVWAKIEPHQKRFGIVDIAFKLSKMALEVKITCTKTIKLWFCWYPFFDQILWGTRGEFFDKNQKFMNMAQMFLEPSSFGCWFRISR